MHWMISGRGVKRFAAPLVVAAFISASMAETAVAYQSETEPAATVMDDAVDFNAKVSWVAYEVGQYWFEWRPTTGSGWVRTEVRAFGPMPAAGQAVLTEKIRTHCDEVEGNCTVVDPDSPLQPNSGYVFRFCRNVVTPGRGGSTGCVDSTGTLSGTNYDSFVALEPWDDTSHEDEPCPDPAAPDGSGASCLENDGPAPSVFADDATYSVHRTATDVYGIMVGGRLTEIWGTWQWWRDINISGAVAQMWQAATHYTGPALRYDMRMKLYRGDNHYLVDEWREILPSRDTFTTGHQSMTSQFFRGRPDRKYHLHWRVYFRAEGKPNPNHPSGLFHSPRRISPTWNCNYNATDEVVCFFP